MELGKKNIGFGPFWDFSWQENHTDLGDFSTIPVKTESNFPPSEDQTKENSLQLINLAALDIWKSYIAEGEKSDNDAANGYWNQFKEALETSFKDRGKTERDDRTRGWANERALVAEIEKLIQTGITSTISSALYLIEKGMMPLPEKGSAHIQERARAYLGYDRHSDPGLISQLIRYTKEASPDSNHAKSLLEETFSNLEAKDSAIKTAYAIYSLVHQLSPEEQIQRETQGHLNALQGHSSFKRAAEKFLYSLSPTEVAVNVGLMFVAGGLGNLAKLLAMKKFEQAGVTGFKAIAGATSTGFAVEMASLGTFNNLQQLLSMDPSKMTAKDIADNYKKAASMIGFTKVFGNIGSFVAPNLAKSLSLATQEGLTLGGKALTWGVGHTAGLSGMIASSRFNQIQGWQQAPIGGENESLMNDFLGYVEFAGAQRMAHSTVDALTQGKLSAFQQKQHQEISELTAKLISKGPAQDSPGMAATWAGAAILLVPELAHLVQQMNDVNPQGSSENLLPGLAMLLGTLKIIENKKDDADLELGKTSDWKSILSQLWEKGKTEAKLARKGVSVDFEGQTYQVKHNRRYADAILRIQSSNDPTKLIFVILENAYLKIPRHHGNLHSEINDKVNMKWKISGQVNAKGDFVVDSSGEESAAHIHSLLEKITRISDLNTGIKNFRLRWQDDPVLMLPYSLQYPFYDMVRVSEEGDLIVHNFQELGSEQVHAEQHEREIGTGIQKAINLKEGIVTPQDSEDIEIRITDQKVLDYIQSLVNRSGQDPQHPQFQELYNFYVSILLQVKSTRDSLDHLIPVQHNELLRTIIGGDGMHPTAYYRSKGTERGNKSYLDLQESHYQAHLGFPPIRYNFSEGPSTLEIDPVALKAEIRHHIHYMNMDLLGNKLPPGLFGSGVTEAVDDMQFFANDYYQAWQARHDFLLTSIFGSSKEREEMASKNKVDKAISRRNQFWWNIGTIFDQDNFRGLNGHIFTKHIRDVLIEKLSARPKLSPEEVHRIDKSLFDYLSNIPVLERCPWQFLIDGIKRLKRLTSLGSEGSTAILAGTKISLWRYLGLDEGVEIDEASLFRMGDLYESFQSQLSEYLMLAEYVPKDNGDIITQLRRQDIFSQLRQSVMQLGKQMEELRGLMLQLHPFHAPDGKDYISPSAYYLNPEVIYSEIIKQHPELGSSGTHASADDTH